MNARTRQPTGAPTKPVKPKTVRYWPGKAPIADDPLESSDSNPSDTEHPTPLDPSDDNEDEDITEAVNQRMVSSTPATSISHTLISKDRRLNRLSQRSQRDEAPSLSRTDSDSVQIRVSTTTLETQGNDGEADASDVEDENALKRRERIREQALLHRTREEASATFAENRKTLEKKRVQDDDDLSGDQNETDQDSEEEDEDESDEEEDEAGYSLRPMLKPIFVPKKHRETVLERDRLIQEQEDAEKERIEKLKERKKESQNLVDELLQKELVEAQAETQILDIDDTDGLDEVAEYEAWKLRELHRIKQYREERDQRDAEMRDIERRRNMTDAEIAAENRSLGLGEKEKVKHAFMQKYYHKGAFYVDDGRIGDALKKTDGDAPTLEDRFDKSALPAVMQVKNFGRAGQTKYTHLLDQDTTNVDSAWSKKSDVNKKMTNRLGGMKSVFEKPTKKRRAGE
ncbi:hypothetical protein QVD99_002942 [Batrachochytrium dendrobatidis]|nr:hypothetical protein O5D80_003164 [Batrachochytrium dendrobatidis]KAK5671184.1 hypothetical protein QVD99_002942 [Batrachochytrium dendrobatidis]